MLPHSESIGGPGNDTVAGTTGPDNLYGLAGDDVLQGGEGDDSLYGGPGADNLQGGSGFDYARYDDGSAGGVTVVMWSPDLNTGAAAGDTFTGVEGLILTASDDTGHGNAADNRLVGGAGNDRLYGLGGVDALEGGDGDDLLWPGSGNAFVDGGPGFDIVRFDDAGYGDLQFYGGIPGSALVFHRMGWIELRSVEGFALGSGNDTAQGYPGADFLAGLAGTDHLYGLGGEDLLDGGEGDDFLYGGAGADALRGGPGVDHVRYDDGRSGSVVAVLWNPALNTGDAAGDTYQDVEHLILTPSNDAGHGNAADNIVQGLAGDDWLYGLGGDDILLGGSGNDMLFTGTGGTNRHSGNTVDGGDGFDFVRFDDADYGPLTVWLGDSSFTRIGGQENRLFFQSVEGLMLGASDDAGYGSNLDNYLYGWGGNDSLYGQGGSDQLFGGSGDDGLRGGLGSDGLFGDDGFDVAVYDDASYAGFTVSLADPSLNTGPALGDSFSGIEGLSLGPSDDMGHGDHRDNHLYGDFGNDTLNGAGGSDLLHGGVGSDTFRFDTALGPGNVDLLFDFQTGVDKISLSASLFAALGPTVEADEVHHGATATTGRHFLLFDASTRSLYYDADANGPGAPVLFATFEWQTQAPVFPDFLIA